MDDASGDPNSAIGNRYVSLLRELVPEFEGTFAAMLQDDDEAGSFEAVSTFGLWVTQTLDPAVLVRAFGAIETAELRSEQLRWNEASGLTVEFCEVIRAEEPASRFSAYMGPRVREWFRLYGHGDGPATAKRRAKIWHRFRRGRK